MVDVDETIRDNNEGEKPAELGAEECVRGEVRPVERAEVQLVCEEGDVGVGEVRGHFGVECVFFDAVEGVAGVLFAH